MTVVNHKKDRAYIEKLAKPFLIQADFREAHPKEFNQAAGRGYKYTQLGYTSVFSHMKTKGKITKQDVLSTAQMVTKEEFFSQHKRVAAKAASEGWLHDVMKEVGWK